MIQSYIQKFVDMCVSGFNTTPSKIIEKAEEAGQRCINDGISVAKRFKDLPIEVIEKNLAEFKEKILEGIQKLKLGPKGFIYLSGLVGGAALALIAWGAHGYVYGLWIISATKIVGGTIAGTIGGTIAAAPTAMALSVAAIGAALGFGFVLVYAAYHKFSGKNDKERRKLTNKIGEYFFDAEAELFRYWDDAILHPSESRLEIEWKNESINHVVDTKLILDTPFRNGSLSITDWTWKQSDHTVMRCIGM